MNRIIFILMLTGLSYAGTDGTIRGKVISNNDGQGLAGVQVFIASEEIGAVTDLDGNYLILNVPVGEHELTVNLLGYKTIKSNVDVTMDRTTWYNVSLEVSALEGETVYISGEEGLVEKGRTAKKVTVKKEAIEALPIKDVSELYNLQAGVVKVESGTRGAVPNNEDRGVEEVHVRGGRSGEIAYMIDGLYIRNPIYGGIGSGTRLNLFAVKQFDWQPGGFNAEYGDAMSAVSNMHTMSGSNKKYQFRTKYETSVVGGALFDNKYDDLRGYNDYNIGFGGPVPFINNLTFWVSSQKTGNDSYRVYEFDDLAYVENDPGNNNNRANIVAPWDTYTGMKGFGFDKTEDVFSKLSYKLNKSIKFNVSHWVVYNHRKIFNSQYIYFNGDGNHQNELFKDTERTTFELNHDVNSKIFYTLRLSNFSQESFQGVRWRDSDNDGYPDWFEWRHPAGDRQTSNPYDEDVIPYTGLLQQQTISYTNVDGLGPNQYSSGWYLGAEPGTYNWEVAEPWNDLNGNGLCEDGEFIPFSAQDLDADGVWDGPRQISKAIKRDGSYWLTPEMYVNYEDFYDEYYWYRDYDQNPFNAYFNSESELGDLSQSTDSEFSQILDSLYFLPLTPTASEQWTENKIFGGTDRIFGNSNAETNEIRFDLTGQLTNEWRTRVGFDLKSHKLEFYEVREPWLGSQAITQRFAEQWDDFGADGVPYLESVDGSPDAGEGNGVWDPGEAYDDFNGNDKWDNYVEPVEFAFYVQNTFEVPWMVINAGARIDAVNYNTKIWSDPESNYTPNEPWFFVDWGLDGLEWIDGNGDNDWLDENGNPDQYFDANGVLQTEIAPDEGENDGQYNSGGNGVYDQYDPSTCILCGDEEFTDLNGNGLYDQGEPFIDEGEPAGLISQGSNVADARVIFKNSEWIYEISPRVGFSHVITDDATFTFNYGVYNQTPVYENIYFNTSRQEDPEEVFEESAGFIGNATMSAMRTQSYEFAFNVQGGRNWAYTVGAWVKDMDQLVSSKSYRSGVYEYQVASNGDFGRAIGIDLSLRTQGLFTTDIQYTYSRAIANGDYDVGAFGTDFANTPAQEYRMSFDRTHDLTASAYARLPYNITLGATYFYQSGVPYTPYIYNASGEKPYEDVLNKNTETTDAFQRIDMSISYGIKLNKTKVSLGMNVFNLFDIKNVIDIYPLTGEPDNPGTYYRNPEIENLPRLGGEYSRSYYDRPWYYSSPREINFFVRFDFN
tara:strand:- start:4932 stop:8612 length:3681 start_codon:yes stop_codon:yes gene_type:complete